MIEDTPSRRLAVPVSTNTIAGAWPGQAVAGVTFAVTCGVAVFATVGGGFVAWGPITRRL